MDEENVKMDLTPRAPKARVTPKWLPLLVLLAIAIAVVVLIWFLVTNTQSFLPADEAVEERSELGERRFQILGSPIGSTTSDQTVIIGENEYTFFTIVFDGVLVDVVSTGTPPDLFDEGIPVVLEGKWNEGPLPAPDYIFKNGANDGWWFSTNRILVKHDNDYREERIDDAEERGQIPKVPDS
jgi:cytochrome c-type biogenesis protein CcmE